MDVRGAQSAQRIERGLEMSPAPIVVPAHGVSIMIGFGSYEFLILFGIILIVIIARAIWKTRK